MTSRCSRISTTYRDRATTCEFCGSVMPDASATYRSATHPVVTSRALEEGSTSTRLDVDTLLGLLNAVGYRGFKRLEYTPLGRNGENLDRLSRSARLARA